VVGSLVLDERVGQPDLDERLSADAESTSLLITLAQEIYREGIDAEHGLAVACQAALGMSQGR
jgi:hypothetical protein